MQTNAIILHVWSPNNVSSPLNEDYLSLSLSDASKSDRTSASQVVSSFLNICSDAMKYLIDQTVTLAIETYHEPVG